MIASFDHETKREVTDTMQYTLVAAKRLLGTSCGTHADWDNMPSEARVGLACRMLESLTVTEMADVAKDFAELQSRIACVNASRAALSEVIEAAVDCGWDPDDSDLPEWLRRVDPGEVIEAAVDCGWDPDVSDLPEWLRRVDPGEVIEAAVDCGWDPDVSDLPEWLRRLKAEIARISEEFGLPPSFAPAYGEFRTLLNESADMAKHSAVLKERERCARLCDENFLCQTADRIRSGE